MERNYDGLAMHGNHHAPADLNRDPAEPALTLWLGLPAARDRFDASTLNAPERAQFAALRSPRRRADFEVSRALRTFADVGSAAHSLSHSNGQAALLLGPSDWQLGVDLEIGRPRDVLRLARFAFDASEARALEAAAPELRPQLFYTLWTMKESFAKALRLDLVDALRLCVFSWNGAAWRGSAPTDSSWSVAVFQPRPEIFLAAACVGTERLPPVRTWEWPPQQRAEWPLIACACAPATVGAARA
jgi:hypothetical protein